MNVELLLKIKEQILKEPENFVMSVYHCGTAHCIGGWAQVMTGPRVDSMVTTDALNALDISLAQGDKLFYVAGWPTKFRLAYVNDVTREGRVKAAVDRIDHFIATNGEE